MPARGPKQCVHCSRCLRNAWCVEAQVTSSTLAAQSRWVSERGFRKRTVATSGLAHALKHVRPSDSLDFRAGVSEAICRNELSHARSQALAPFRVIGFLSWGFGNMPSRW
eukprot:1779033-Alexandrium_andersonii.AAC.1